jgi:hypothetical protein
MTQALYAHKNNKIKLKKSKKKKEPLSQTKASLSM